ncbi:MAG: AsnC family transcriptional regulator [Actinobacteria bacterium]|uniref:Unannotated protein n=1 Tax=freshwater metagenome TaxID=449393 RepID=A0A6J7KCU0_9ZZZZ|nr:AsnC family transcriptional regulator [Actinomycetota bacterium]
MDNVDWQIVGELQGDARLSFSELSRRVHLSTPAVSERVRRLERSGLIRGYRADIDPVGAGWAVDAFVRLSCYGPTCILRDPEVLEWPEILELHRVTGNDCSLIRVVAQSMQDFEQLIDRLSKYGTPSSTLVLSSPLRRSPVRPPAATGDSGVQPT